MLLNLIQLMVIAIVISGLSLIQKHPHLTKYHLKEMSCWLMNLAIINSFLLILVDCQLSAFDTLMFASANGLGTIAYVFIKNFQEIPNKKCL